MSAQWESKSGEEGGSVWCFATGRTSVRVYGSPSGRFDSSRWPRWAEDQTTSPSDLMALVTLVVDPAEGGRLDITGTIRSWRLLDPNRPSDYRVETHDFERMVKTGESWELPIGRGPDRKECVLDITVRPVREVETPRPDMPGMAPIPLEIRYEIADSRRPGRTVARTAHGVAASGDEETKDLASLEIPVDVPGADSSVLHVSFNLYDLDVDGAGSRWTALRATIEIGRILAINAERTGDPSTIQAERTIISTYRRTITLRPGRILRIELPLKDDEQVSETTTEAIKIEPVMPAHPY
ncbi:MAG: hypothetical protein HY304_05730 [candidate division Zixibacteria bacterium]|nr:hypothetical protein [candidate division Zixibacteria bacterium]